MRTKRTLPLCAALAFTAAFAASTSGVRRTPYTKEEAAALGAPPGAAKMVAVGNLVFPSAVYGSAQDPLRQVEEVVERTHALLTGHGLGIGNMLQHTIFLKDGAASPMDVLTRFHATATRLAPSLKERRSVGTIIRVPGFHDPRTAVMLEIVAGAPSKKEQAGDGYIRIPFTFGPQEIVETIGDDRLLFTAGLEAMDFEHGTLAPKIDEQVAAIAGKLDAALKRAGLSLNHMVQHNLYITRGTDPLHVIRRFHEEVRKRAPEAKQYPSAGTVMVVDGMAAPGFLMEMDAVAARGRPEGLGRVPFTEASMEVAKAVAADGLVYLTAMPGADFAAAMTVPESVDAQIEAAVRNVRAALEQAGLSLANIVKHRIIVKKGAADPARVRAGFYEVALRYAPALRDNPSAETFLIVEALAGDRRSFELAVIAAR